MEADDMERRTGTRIEQHIGTILQLTVVGLLAWSLSTTQGMSKEVEVLKVKVESLSLSISQDTNDRYRSSDAARDLKYVYEEMARHDKRQDFLERRVSEIEKRR